MSTEYGQKLREKMKELLAQAEDIGEIFRQDAVTSLRLAKAVKEEQINDIDSGKSSPSAGGKLSLYQ
ncbi:MAG: hypothetical protein AAFO04_28870 [Cyanobacteria bacterium J06592_8]